MTATAAEHRHWRLIGYAGKDVAHKSTCYGDRALDIAMKRLEARSDITRITARLA